ncbi:MAG: hypothetical protein L0Y56_15030, partial [Nitrospira sp.]|nr:hypothetical protein [Nitrospira sp.]
MALPLMYPARIDRYRIIEKLIRWARETYHISETGQQGIKQTALAERARVSQTVVSNIENLVQSLTSAKRSPNREEFVKVLTWGLELDQEKVDALLWLYDGIPLTEDEIRCYVRGYLPQTTVKHYTLQELRSMILRELEGVLMYHAGSNRIQTVTVRMIPFGDEGDELKAYEELIQMERLPGQSLVVMEHPSHLTNPPEMQRSGELTRLPVITDEGRQKWLALNEERVATFLTNLATYGERSIHCKSSLKTYVGKETPHTMREQRRKQIRHWITLLESYEHYQVGLAETTPSLEVKIKSTVEVMVRSVRDYTGDSRQPRW